MPILNTMDKLYVGSEELVAAMLGRTAIWTPPLASIWFGTQNTGGAGNWGTSADRMMLCKWTLTQDMIAQRMFIGFGANSPTTEATSIKGVVYRGNGPGDKTGTLALASAIVTNPGPYPGGVQEYAIANVLLTAGIYWIGGIADNFSSEFDSGEGVAAGNTVMYNGQTTFGSPGDLTAETPTAQYANSLACYVEGVPA